jgi:hypothetical protein
MHGLILASHTDSPVALSTTCSSADREELGAPGC